MVNLTSLPGKIVEQVIEESISKLLEENKVIRNNQYEVIKSKPCLTNSISFYGKVTGCRHGVIYPDFVKALEKSPARFSLTTYGNARWECCTVDTQLAAASRAMISQSPTGDGIKCGAPGYSPGSGVV